MPITLMNTYQEPVDDDYQECPGQYPAFELVPDLKTFQIGVRIEAGPHL